MAKKRKSRNAEIYADFDYPTHCIECRKHKKSLLDSYICYKPADGIVRIICDQCLVLHYEGSIESFDRSFDYLNDCY